MSHEYMKKCSDIYDNTLYKLNMFIEEDNEVYKI